MRKKLANAFILVAAIVLCVLTAYADDTFSCAVTDQQGNVIHGYHDTQKEQWYLFLTNQVVISDAEVQLQGAVVSADKGTLDPQTNVLRGAFTQNGDSVVISLADGSSETITVMQSELPSLYIALDGVTLDTVHQDKSVKYAGTAVTLTDTANKENDLHVTNATFKGRGNTSWAYYQKKGYQIKFDKKTSVLGIAKAKKWVLLANASDDSMMRNKLSFSLADQLGMTYAPDCAYVDLWINGEYRGTYLVCEKVELGTTRLNLNDPKGVLMEQDEAYFAAEDIWIENHSTGKHFVVKESVTEDDPALLQEAVKDFDDALNAFMEYAATTPDDAITLQSLSRYIDVDSFLQYYLVNEFVLNRESAGSSFYWYKDGEQDVLHLGPVWDFDTCMGNDVENADSHQTAHIYNHIVFRKLLSIPVVRDEMSRLLLDYAAAFGGMDDKAESLYTLLQASASMNYTRWDDLKGGFGGKGTYFAGTYQEAKENLSTWLGKRETAFTAERILQYVDRISVSVDLDRARMDLSFMGADAGENLWFVVWSEENGQDDIVWYPAAKQADGKWHCAVDLVRHQSTGVYNVHVWAGNAGKPTAAQLATQVYVSAFNTVRPAAAAEVSANCQTMQIVAGNIEGYDKVYFPVWSAVNGQDDIVWYPAVKQADGTWTYTVNLANHNSTGNYLIHVYGAKNGKMEMLTNTTAYVEKLAARVAATVSADCRTMQLVVTNIGEYEQVYLPTWSAVNGQDDIVWYPAEKQADGAWTYTVDLSNHNSTGNYMIHVYGKRDGKQELITSTAAYVEKLPPRVTAEVPADCRTMRLIAANIDGCDQVYLATWSVTDGQDDIVWYSAEKQADGTWAYTVDLRKHHTAGQYMIHVYGRNEQGGELHLLTNTTAYVKRAILPDDPYVTVELSADCRTMKLTVQNASKYERVYLPVWSEINGQDDLTWYTAQRTADGLWVYTVDMTAHHSAGTYYVHVYGEKGGELQLLASAAPSVKLAAA